MMPMDYSGVGWKKKRKGAKIQISGGKQTIPPPYGITL